MVQGRGALLTTATDVERRLRTAFGVVVTQGGESSFGDGDAPSIIIGCHRAGAAVSCSVVLGLGTVPSSFLLGGAPSIFLWGVEPIRNCTFRHPSFGVASALISNFAGAAVIINFAGAAVIIFRFGEEAINSCCG